MTEKRFYTDGQYVMQDGEVYVICSGEHNADVVATALNELLTENEQLKQTIKTIKEICNQHKIPTCLTAYIPVNCEKRKGCLDNHMITANNMGKSNLAKEILEVINGDD